MKAVNFKLNTVLAAVTGIACLAIVLARTFAPYMVTIPLVSIPNIAAVSVAAAVADCYLDWKKPVPARCWVLTALLAALTFWLMPWAAGLVDAGEALRVGVIGGLVFTAVAFMFTGIRQKIFSGPAGKGWLAFVSPVASGFVLFMAFQAFAAVLL